MIAEDQLTTFRFQYIQYKSINNLHDSMMRTDLMLIDIMSLFAIDANTREIDKEKIYKIIEEIRKEQANQKPAIDAVKELLCVKISG